MAEKELSSEVLKLMDKMTKDPTSRFFVPLAEEYMKCDMLDEAALVLGDGIKNHPNYLAGRMLLGKVYLQKKQIPEAKAEFEQAIQINPESILAHKKLAQIYQAEAQVEKAIEACRKVVMIDPTDKETKALLAALEKEGGLSRRSDGAPTPPAAAPEPPPVEKAEPIPKAPQAEAPVAAPAPSWRETNPAEEISSQQLPEASKEEMIDLSEDWEGERTFFDEVDSLREEGPRSPSQEGRSSEAKASEEELLSTTLASLYVSQGHYEKAIEVYKKLLARDPSDEESLQGLEKTTQKWVASKEGASSSTAGADSEKGRSTGGKTQRLQSWLDSIREDERK